MKEKDKDFIKTIKEYIDTHYADKQISIDFLSELTGYSIMRINDVYKNATVLLLWNIFRKNESNK